MDIVHWPSKQEIPGSNLAGCIYLSFSLTSYFLLWYLIFIRDCNFVTRVAKHSSQTFNINRRNNHKGIFSYNL